MAEIIKCCQVFLNATLDGIEIYLWPLEKYALPSAIASSIDDATSVTISPPARVPSGLTRKNSRCQVISLIFMLPAKHTEKQMATASQSSKQTNFKMTHYRQNTPIEIFVILRHLPMAPGRLAGPEEDRPTDTSDTCGSGTPAAPPGSRFRWTRSRHTRADCLDLSR